MLPRLGGRRSPNHFHQRLSHISELYVTHLILPASTRTPNQRPLHGLHSTTCRRNGWLAVRDCRSARTTRRVFLLLSTHRRDLLGDVALDLVDALVPVAGVDLVDHLEAGLALSF